MKAWRASQYCAPHAQFSKRRQNLASRTLRRRTPAQHGFTLIEVLVVVLIIGILAAIAIPGFLSQKQRAQDSQAKSLLRNAAIAMETYFAEHKNFDGVTAGAGGTIAAVEANISWLSVGGVTAQAKRNQVDIALRNSSATPATLDRYILSTQSASGAYFAYIRDENATVQKCKGSSITSGGAFAVGTPGYPAHCVPNQW